MKTITLMGKAFAILCLSLLFAGCSSESREDEPTSGVVPTNIQSNTYVTIVDAEGNNLIKTGEVKEVIVENVIGDDILALFAIVSDGSWTPNLGSVSDRTNLYIYSRWTGSEGAWTKPAVSYTPYGNILKQGEYNMTGDVIGYKAAQVTWDWDNEENHRVIKIKPEPGLTTIITCRMEDGSEHVEKLQTEYTLIENDTYVIDKLYLNGEQVYDRSVYVPIYRDKYLQDPHSEEAREYEYHFVWGASFELKITK